ncbi:hypothetical protein BHE74_00005194 [Ensete ventricosum]|nr:hypothetical protein BHE74_00005194 [Ensete ventricosum]
MDPSLSDAPDRALQVLCDPQFFYFDLDLPYAWRFGELTAWNLRDASGYTYDEIEDEVELKQIPFLEFDVLLQSSFLQMDSGGGVESELRKGAVEKAPEANGFKENEVTENGADAVHIDSGSDSTSKVEAPDSSGDGDEAPTSVTKNKAPPDSSESVNTDSAAEATINGTSAEDARAGCGFSFRLDERAEKRKEFFMKLEEKNHAKELEKTNLQAKSKENQEAEIKRLRKTLTFKATPIPSFYQEPGPPKVELKKVTFENILLLIIGPNLQIPPTRARSPKLGRRKQSVSAADGSSEVGTSSSTKPSDGAASSKGNAALPKKPKQKLLSKLPSQTSPTAVKPDAKSLKPGTEKPEVGNISAETCVAVASASPGDSAEEAQTNCDLPESEVVAQEVPARG